MIKSVLLKKKFGYPITSLLFHLPQFSIFLIFIIAGCDKFDKDEPIPAYLSIQPFNLIVNPDSQGTSSSKISEVWVYVDDQHAGVYEINKRIPVLFSEKKGGNKITLFPGIRKNGISSTKTEYPFFQRYNETSKLTAGNTLVINPVTSYFPETKFSLLEGFEKVDSMFISEKESNAMWNRTTDPVKIFEGAASAEIILEPEDTIFIGSTVGYDSLPLNAQVYLEMNYSTTNNMTIGLKSRNSNGNKMLYPILVVFPTTDTGVSWKKIYVELAPVIGLLNESGFKTHSVYFQITKKNGEPTSYSYLDNLKLVHF